MPFFISFNPHLAPKFTVLVVVVELLNIVCAIFLRELFIGASLFLLRPLLCLMLSKNEI